MKREYYDYIKDILDSINEIEEFTKGMNYEGFIKDKKTVNAVIRCLEITGEASKKIPPDIIKRHTDIPWKRMAGMRDKLIHEYHGIDLEIVWVVMKEELPPLKPKIKAVLDLLK